MFKLFIGTIATSLKQKVINILITLSFIIGYIYSMVAFYRHLYIAALQFSPPSHDETEPSELYKFVIRCIETPIWEEFLFRVFPIQVVLALGKGLGKEFQETILPYIIVFVSIVFGLGHGGVEFVFMQGVAGLALSRLYIKNGYNYPSLVITHFLWNLTVFYIIPG